MPYVKTTANSRNKSKQSRDRKRAFIALVTLAVIALAVIAFVRGVSVHAPKTVTSEIPTAAPRIAATSPPSWRPTELARAHAMLAQTFGPVLGARDRASLVVLGARGETLYSYGATNGVTPASVQKLIVAFSSLNLLGPSYRYHTILAADHPVSTDGTLNGNLWLVGSGDPSFRSDDLRAGVTMLRRAGLARINGSAAIDPNVMRGPEINPRWSAADAGEDFQTAVSGISIDGDTAEFRIYGTTPGAPARVVVVPRTPAIRTYGSVTTSGAADSVIIAPEADNTFRFSGYIPPGVEEKYWLPVLSIPQYAGSVLATMLTDAGIRTASRPVIAGAPLTSIALWEHRSAALPVLVKHMLYQSDNHFAEQLLRTLGVDAGAQTTDRDGIDAEFQFLRSRAIPTDNLRLFDGSGLAEANRVSALTLARILSDAELRDGGAELYPLLPAGGREGTLKHYQFQTARVRAKTGHLSDADSLAGYVDTKHHGRLAFAFMIDDSAGDPDTAYVHALDALSEF
jgi:D-alanyl-D-alanine carboxypeptidase/D-alanyl-D-alanine-endopeptidase (penicillin-binding protein 4)